MSGKAPYTPTPNEIRRRCVEIQEGWTAEEEIKRRCYGVRSPNYNERHAVARQDMGEVGPS